MPSNQTKKAFMISLTSLLADPKVQQSPPNKKAAAIREVLLRYLQAHHDVELDLSSTSSLTPSFAYEAFGYLYDDLKDDLVKRLTISNDTNSIAGRIFGAIERRRLVYTAEHA